MTHQMKDIKQRIKEEYARCYKDPIYFMKKFLMVQHPTRGLVHFNLFPFQEDVQRQLIKNDYNIFLKSRQMGISTLTGGYAFWQMVFVPNTKILVIATKQEVAKNLVKIVRTMYDNIPSWLKPDAKEKNILSIHLNNGSFIKATSASSDAGRSESLSMLIIDEGAFIDKIDEIWASAQQTIATGGKAIVISTPNGRGNWFHKMWVKATEKSYTEGEMRFNAIKLHWSQHPERDEGWYKNQCSIIGDKRIIAQELDTSFISSGNNVIDPEILKWYQQNYVKDPLEKRGFDRNLWVWEYPQPQKNYIVVADVSRGDSTDYSACHVMDIDNMEQVAEYKGKIGTKEYGDFLITLATEYNDALLVIENASVGWATIQRVIDREYKNLYYTYKSDGYIDPEIQLAKGYDLKDKQDMIPGFSTTSKTRPLIIDKLRQYMQEEIIIFHSERIINELFVFIWDGSKAQAQRGYNDDLVMSGAISAWVRDTAIKLRSQGMDLTKKALTNIHKTGVNGTIQTNRDNPYSMKVGNDSEDIKWLF